MSIDSIKHEATCGFCNTWFSFSKSEARPVVGPTGRKSYHLKCPGCSRDCDISIGGPRAEDSEIFQETDTQKHAR